MHGADNNNYSCIPCNTGYYNLEINSVKQCVTCDLEKHQKINCIDEKIIISKDYWASHQ